MRSRVQRGPEITDYTDALIEVAHLAAVERGLGGQFAGVSWLWSIRQ